MDKLTQAAARAKKFVHDHKVGIAIAATSVCWITVIRIDKKIVDDFLLEKGLYDELYHPIIRIEK